jgi:hypothetical protein
MPINPIEVAQLVHFHGVRYAFWKLTTLHRMKPLTAIYYLWLARGCGKGLPC